MIENGLSMNIIENAMEMYLLFEGDGTISYCNAKAKTLLGYPENYGELSIENVFPGNFRISGGRFQSDLPMNGTRVELSAYRQNRTCFTVEAQFYSYGTTFICMAMDISKQNYFEKKASHSTQEIEATQQVRTQFVANVTHELRTPVNGIQGNVRELQSIEEDSHKKYLLSLLERGCNDMHSIINNILDFSKLEAGKFLLESRKFRFRDMMDYIKATHNNKIAEKGLQFFVTISSEIPEYIVGDELRIQQILNNLLSNATKFTHAGKISLEAVKTAQIDNKIELYFMVLDTGIGISRENQQKLFKSFSQVDASTTRKYGGTGLGLSISKQLVEMMDGSIHVESEERKGTMFSFRIWVELPEDEVRTETNPLENIRSQIPPTTSGKLAWDETDAMFQFGTKENMEELQKKLSKLILCVEMTNWEKAETFMDAVKQLTEEAPREIKSLVLRLKMAVQKEDYDKISTAFENLKSGIEAGENE